LRNEEDFDAGHAAFLMDGEDVGLFDRARMHAVMRLNGRERREAVAQGGGAFEIQRVRRLLHFLGERFLHLPAAAGKKVARLGDQRIVFGSAISPVHGPEQRLI
jgi:hypothetical protein